MSPIHLVNNLYFRPTHYVILTFCLVKECYLTSLADDFIQYFAVNFMTENLSIAADSKFEYF